MIIKVNTTRNRTQVLIITMVRVVFSLESSEVGLGIGLGLGLGVTLLKVR
jgi:hypothetical protein